MNMIVAVDKNWGIGKDNKLLDHIPEDLSYFKKITTNNIIIMGRKTFESFPNKKTLPNRTNIIITSDTNYEVENAIMANSIEHAIEIANLLKDISNNTKEIFFIGGASIYEQCEKFCSKAYITKINKEYNADRFIKNFDNDNNWKLISENNLTTNKNINLNFCIYENALLSKK